MNNKLQNSLNSSNMYRAKWESVFPSLKEENTKPPKPLVFSFYWTTHSIDLFSKSPSTERSESV
jgi:hypothetical protein